MHRGVAFADFDNDGRIDAVVTVVERSGETVPQRVRAATRTGWRSACAAGAPIARGSAPSYTCTCRMAATSTTRPPPQSAIACSSEPLVRFGLGANPVAEGIEIRWPGGSVQHIANVAADRIVDVVEEAKP